MHHRLVPAPDPVRPGLAQPLRPEAIEEAGRRAGHTWRQRVLDPVTTIHSSLPRGLAANTAITHRPRLAGWSFTDGADGRARSRLPSTAPRAPPARITSAVRPITEGGPGDGHGHRPIPVDGSGPSMPETAERRERLGRSEEAEPGRGPPVARLMVVARPATGPLPRAPAAPLHGHDMGPVARAHPGPEPGDVMGADRGPGSFAHRALIRRRRLHATSRAHPRQIVDSTPGRPHASPAQERAARGMPRSRWARALGVMDQVVDCLKPRARPDRMAAGGYDQSPESIRVREPRYRAAAPGLRAGAVTIVTTPADAGAYPAGELAGASGPRWQVEVDLRHLKTTTGPEVPGCMSHEGALEGLTAFGLVYDPVRVVTPEAARRQRVEPGRIRSVDAPRWPMTARPGEGSPESVVDPRRPHRADARVIKRRPKNYPWMSKPRSVLRKRLLQQQAVDNTA